MAMNPWRGLYVLAVVGLGFVPPVHAATIYVAAGGDLQQALDTAAPGDTILLAEGAEFVGNFVLPFKSGAGWVTVRTSAPDSVLVPNGVRIHPTHAPLLARLRSPNAAAALRTAAGTHHWEIRYLEFGANPDGYGDIIQVGDGSSAQNSLNKVPHHIVLNHLYVHGDPAYGQKRCIALNASSVTISDSYIAECKTIAQDSQGIGGWNGPGPYTIENNYIEGAGENVMFGGADPAIVNLVADGIVFRGNHVTRPLTWRAPIISTPVGVTAASEADGSLPAGTYGYRVVARRSVSQGVMGRSAASAEVVVATSAPGAVRIRWAAVAGATEYRVYGRTPGTEAIYWRVTTTQFVDDGASGTSEAVPTSAGTVWSVKNLFELKNARNVLVEDNIFENHWKESQPGYAIVLTPRNSNGTCSWCVVERVRFEHNVVRNVAAGINLLGYDNGNPSKQAADIVFRENLFTGLSKSLGGNGWFMLIGDGPRDVVIDHNTIDFDGSTVVSVYGGTSADPREVHGFQMIANAARHGNYGINGAFFAFGNGILEGFFPGAVFTANYLAGGSASRFPVGTLFAGVFSEQFANPAASDYTVRDGSLLKGAAPDGRDIGVDYPALAARIAGVVGGRGAISPPALIAPRATFVSSCTYLDCTFSNTSVAGSSSIAQAAWTFGDGVELVASNAAHTFAAGGTYTVTLTVRDANDLTSSSSQTTIVVARNVAPVADFQSNCVDLVCVFTDRSADSDGRVVSWAWNIGSATLRSPSVSHTFAAPGTYQVSLSVVDDDGEASAVLKAVVVPAAVHARYVTSSSRRWNAQTNPSIHYWSVEVTLAIKGADARPIAGATITAAWSGALTRAITCTTNAVGVCTFKSGTLSMWWSWVTLTVGGVSAPLAVYEPAKNIGLTGNAAGTAVKFLKP